MISKEVLIEEYVKKEKPMYQIASEQKVAVGTVFNYMKRYKIPTRKGFTKAGLEKMRVANRGNQYKTGFALSREARERISQARKGKFNNPSEYGGHKKKRSDGYIKVYLPSHPYCTKDGYVMEHILVMEKEIGRYITRDEVVHHQNHIRDDNRIENLQLMTFKEHASLHMRERWAKRREE
jgi:hypothetical protein